MTTNTTERADCAGSQSDDHSEELAYVRARAEAYALFAATFDGDTDMLCRALDNGVFTAIGEVLPVTIDTTTLENADIGPETLAVAYDNLFVVPGETFVPPFGSAYGDPSESFESDSRYHDEGSAGELLGGSAEQMTAFYERLGFRPDRGDGIPDHLAAVFEFLSALAAREADCRAAGTVDDADALRELQQEILASLSWLDSFHDRLRSVDGESVFARIAGIARTFAAWDARANVATETSGPSDDQ